MRSVCSHEDVGTHSLPAEASGLLRFGVGILERSERRAESPTY